MNQYNNNRPPAQSRRAAGSFWAALVSYALLLGAFWLAARQFKVEASIGGHFPSAFAGFALLLAPYWFFGFGLAEWLRRWLWPQVSAENRGANLGHQDEKPRPSENRAGTGHPKDSFPVPRLSFPVSRFSFFVSRFSFVVSHFSFRVIARVVLPGALVVPYLLFALPRGEVRLFYVALFFALPVGLAALFEVFPTKDGLCWQDVVALAAIGLPVEFRWFESAWPYRGLGAMPKLLLMDAALYAFLVVRRLPHVGYDFRPRWRDVAIGLREWLYFAPIAIVLGVAIRFIRPRPYAPDLWAVAAGWLVTFFFVAIPEELYFRGLLQNLVEKRLAAPRGDGRTRAIVFRKSTFVPSAGVMALLIAAPIFGLSHFNKPLPFNWRYVLLATIAGVFYGRAWLDRRRLFTSGITHATVDVVWSIWFR